MQIEEAKLRTIIREELLRFNRPDPIGAGLPQTLTTKDVSQILGAHPKTIRTWANEGKLTHRRFGRTYHFDKTYIINIAKSFEN